MKNKNSMPAVPYVAILKNHRGGIMRFKKVLEFGLMTLRGTDTFFDCGKETRFYLFDELFEGDAAISCTATLENVQISGTLRVDGWVFMKGNSRANSVEANE